MTKVRESLLYQVLAALGAWLSAAVDASFLAAWTGAVWRWLGRQYQYSLTRVVALWRSLLDEKLPESLCGRALNALLSLPARLFEGSAVAAFLEDFCTRWSLLALSGAFLLLFILPYESWNNYYALYCMLAVVLLLVFSRQRSLRMEGIGFWPLAFALVTLASAFWSSDPGESFRFAVFALICMLAVFSCVHILDSDERMLVLLLAMALGMAVCCAFGLLQSIRGVAPNARYTDLTVNRDMPGRIYSFFDNPNSFANLPLFFSPLLLALVFYSPKLWQRLFFALVFAMATVCLVLTGTRGAWLAWAAAVFVLVLILRPRLAPWLFIFGLAAVPLLPDSILKRLLSVFTGDSSVNSRKPIYMAILRLIKRNAVTGVGLGSTTLRDSLNWSRLYTGSAYFVHGHNLLFQIWGESGVFALISYGFATFFPVKEAIRAGAAANGTLRAGAPGSKLNKAVAAGAACGILGALIFGLTDYIWSYPRVMILYWFLFGILLAAVKRAKAQPPAPLENGTE